MPLNHPNVYQFSEKSVEMNAPPAPGLYGLLSSEDWIYVGESDNIRARLLGHLRGDNACISLRQPPFFTYVIAPDHTVSRQNKMIRQLNPRCNEKPWLNPTLRSGTKYGPPPSAGEANKTA